MKRNVAKFRNETSGNETHCRQLNIIGAVRMTDTNEKEFYNLSAEPNIPIAAKPRINPVAQYLLALAAVIAAYSAYAKFLVPVIEGPPLAFEKHEAPLLEDLPSPRDEKSHLAPLLPTDAWEMTNCKTLLIDAGTILFKELEQQPDGSLTVVPFTLITGMDAKPIVIENSDTNSKSPTVLRCISGATLKFNKPIQEVFSGGAKLESARLTGQVDIYRPPSDAGKNDALHIVTSNIQVDKRRVYTLDKVEFSFGPNRGSGRNLLIDLDHDSKTPSLADFSNVKGVRRMELAFLDRLRIEPSKKTVQTIKTDSNQTESKRQLFSGNKSPLEVSCKGAFVFDFRSQTATFKDQVVARQDDAFNDQINCEKLTLTFEDKPDTAGSSKLDLNQPLAVPVKQSSNSDIQLKRFIAEGSPAIVVSRSRSAKISGAYLSYDVATNRIAGSCDNDANHPVTIVSPEFQLVSKKLTYAIPDDGSLGEVNAIGPGRWLRVETPTQDEFFSTWQKGLTTRSVPESPGLQRIVVDGSAKIRLAKTTRVDAERLEVLVWQTANLVTGADGKIKREWLYQPSKLFTTGNVNIVSPKLDGQAQFLTATWPETDMQMSRLHSIINPNIYRVGYRGTLQSLQQQEGTAPSRLVRIQNNNYVPPQVSNPRSGFVELDSQQRPINSPSANQHAANEASHIRPAGFQENIAPKKPKSKLRFKGETVDVRLVGSGDDTQIRDLTVVGNVTIVNQPIENGNQPANPTETPLTISGHRLQLTPQTTEGNYRTLITGKNGELATVTAKEFALTGQSINLDQDANKVWVEGTGSMKMKVTPESDSKTESLGVQKPAIAQNLDVAWKGGMIFDGSKVYFERDVVMSANQPDKTGNQSNIQSLSEGLSIELTAPINFQDMNSDQKKPKAKIRELVLVDQVPKSKQVFKMVKHSSENTDDPTQPVTANASNVKRPVVIENRIFSPAGQMLEQQRISVPQAVVNVDAGTIKSKGPGSIATHRWKDPSGSSSDDKPNPFGRIGKSKNKSGISFIQVNFDGELNVDRERNEMILDRNIRTVYSPVQDWKTAFNPDMPQRRGPGGVYLTCEKLQLAHWVPRGAEEKSNELIATGNAHILSDEFEATADRVSYSQASDLLVIVGSPRNNATLKLDGQPVSAEKFTYRIKDQWTTTQGLRSATLNKK